MSFVKLLKTKNIQEVIENSEIITENKKLKPEEVLRKNGIKIKSVIPTSFGVQIDFMKKYPDEEIEEILSDFTTKIKNKSVFVVD